MEPKSILHQHFDECGFGFRAFDLGTVRFHARAQGQLNDAWQAFREGYSEPFPPKADIQLGTALRIFYTAGKIPLRLDIPELRDDASGFVGRYMSMVAQELETST